MIDLDDETTDEDGNLVYELIANEDLVVWAWTGDLDDEFDLDRTEYVSVQVTAVEPATHILITDDLHPKAIKVPYGRSVTFTFQLVDQYGRPGCPGRCGGSDPHRGGTRPESRSPPY